MDASPPDPPAGLWQQWGVWFLGGAGAVLVIVLAVLFLTGGDDDPAVRADTTSLPADSTVTVVDDDSGTTEAEAGADSSVTSEGTVPTDEGSDATDPPAGWDPHIHIAYEAGTPMTAIRVEWVNHPDASHYTYTFEWEKGPESGSDFGELPGGTEVYPRMVPCEAELDFALVVWDGGTELARTGTASVAIGECEVIPPGGLVGSRYPGHQVAFSWIPGYGYDRYAWEAVFSGTTVGIDSGVIEDPEQGMLTLGVSCGASIEFTIWALEADGTEIRGLRGTFDATPCPQVQIVAGPAFTVAAGTGNGRPAECPAGTSIVGGGFVTSPDTGSLPYPGWVYSNWPYENGWLAYILAPPERDLTIRSYALCMTDVRVVGVAETEHVEVPAGAFRSLVAECPANTVIASGGWDIQPAGPNVLVSARDGNGWRVSVYNELTTAADLWVAPLCVDVRYVIVEDVELTAGVEDGDVGPGTPISCPAGYLMSGGGYASADAIFEVAYPVIVGGEVAWRVEGLNREYAAPGPGVAVEASAVCLSFPP